MSYTSEHIYNPQDDFYQVEFMSTKNDESYTVFVFAESEEAAKAQIEIRNPHAVVTEVTYIVA